MIGFAKRNLKLFFRDKSAVFFSLLAVFIIIGLYALFLGDVWTGGMEGVAEVPGVDGHLDHVRASGCHVGHDHDGRFRRHGGR